MRNCVSKTLPLVLAVLLVAAGSAFGGDNAGVTFSLSTAAEVSGIDAGGTVDFAIDAVGMVGVKQLDIIVQVTPADAFDIAATAYVGPNGFIVPGTEPDPAAGTIKVGGANFMGALDGDASIGTFTFTAAAGYSTSTEATISVVRISLGPSSTDRDIFEAAALGLEATVNPPAPAPGVTAIDPASGSTTGGGAATITGSAFVDGATATIGGADAAAVFVDATSLTVTVPAGAEGAADVVVTNPDGQSGTLAGGYTYVGIIEPTLTAAGATSASVAYSAVGNGEVADGSDGEVTMGVFFTDAAGGPAAGASISFSVENNGSEPVYILGAAVTTVAAGGSAIVSAATDAAGAASIVLDSEADRSAGTTSAAVTASITAANSEGTDRDLSVVFGATWDVPVVAELASFAGSVTPGDGVLLEWSVASQTSNLGWAVYRSVDNVDFAPVGEFVLGDGTTDAFRTYQFTDTDLPLSEVVYYFIEQVDLDGTTARSDVIEVSLDVVALPMAMALQQNYPNPFNPETTIGFELSEEAVVTLRVFDLTGQVVRTLVDGQPMSAGHYESLWDGRTASGVRVASGVYFYEIIANEYSSMRKMTLLQ